MRVELEERAGERSGRPAGGGKDLDGEEAGRGEGGVRLDRGLATGRCAAGAREEGSSGARGAAEVEIGRAHV